MKKILPSILMFVLPVLISCNEFDDFAIGAGMVLKGYQNLSSSGTSNCYIVSTAGTYKFRTLQGNSATSVGAVKSVEVLWETFGTAATPNVGDLVSEVKYKDGYIGFTASGREGNALIAAKDASGNILWSWHIWLTDKPEDQVYNNNAGTMMDRNLGAISATPGSVGALGLLYQWGRKDPFLGSSSISSSDRAKSRNSLGWSTASSTSSNGTIAYATSHPTTFITYNSHNYDWYYTGNSTTDDTRWQSVKTIYDPCPVGYRVPDGGDNNGVWATAFGCSNYFNEDAYDSANRGFDFGSRVSTIKLTSTSYICWYPAAGVLYDYDGSLGRVGDYGGYWSCSPDDSIVFGFYFSSRGDVNPSDDSYRAFGHPVRCLRE